MEGVDLLVVHGWKTLDHVAGDTSDVLLEMLVYVLGQALDCFSRCEDWGNRVVDGEVGKLKSECLVAHVDQTKGMIDEQVAAHQLVDTELFH